MGQHASSLNIFLADDDLDDCQFFATALSHVYPQANLRILHNGKAMLEELSSPKLMPDIIVLDLNMPIMDGYECIRNIKRNPQLKAIPTVILTTSNNLSDTLRLKKIGADLFLTKPCSFGELLDVARKIIEFIKNR